MARYSIPKPAVIRNADGVGVHVGAGATISNPAHIETPDDYEPSVTWTPEDEAAQRALIAMGKKKLAAHLEHLDPVKDKAKYDRESADFMKLWMKELPVVTKPKPQAREISTNAEAAEAQGKKVVGRNADKSPV